MLARTLAQSVVRELDDAGAVIAGRDEAFAPFGRRLGNAPALEKQRGEPLGRPRVKLCTWDDLLEAAGRATPVPSK